MSEPVALVFAPALVIAPLVVSYLGEPPTRLHPVMQVRNYLSLAARQLQPNPSPEVLDLKSLWLAADYW
jgi:cobalamin biosynthesis protein CobD/CbiB